MAVVTVGSDGRVTNIQNVSISSALGLYGNANVAAYMPTYTGSLSNSSTIIGLQSEVNALLANAASQQGQIDSRANIAGQVFTGNVTVDSGHYFLGDGSKLTGISVSSNIQLTGNVTGTGVTGSPINTTISASGVTPGTYGADNAVPVITVGLDGRVTTLTTTPIGSGGGAYGNANVQAYLPTYTGSLSNSSTIIDLYANAATQASQIAGANAAIITANTAMKGYVDAQVTGVTNAWTANAATQQGQIATLQANAASQQTSIDTNTTNISTLFGNAASQQGQITSVTNELHSFETWANLNFSTSSYSNANAAAYLTTATINTTGNIQAANLISSNFLYPNGVSILSGIGGTYGNANVTALLSSNTVATINTTGNITAYGNIVTPGTFYGNLIAANILVANIGIQQYSNYQTATTPGYSKGILWYDNVQDSIAYYNGVTNNTVHVGQETQAKVYNGTASTITQGTPVYATGGSTGTYPNIAPAQANTLTTTVVVGVANQDIPASTYGYIVTEGQVANVSVGTFSTGDTLYLSPYSAGQMQKTVPVTGYTAIVGIVTYANSPNGRFQVKITNPTNNQTFGNITVTGNITGNNASITNLTNTGNLLTTGTATLGNVISTLGYFWSNGAPYAPSSASTYGNANVAAYLPIYGGDLNSVGNITAGNLIATSYLLGDGSQLINLPIQSGTYSNSNVASYLPVYNGAISASSLTVPNINTNFITGNIQSNNLFITDGVVGSQNWSFTTSGATWTSDTGFLVPYGNVVFGNGGIAANGISGNIFASGNITANTGGYFVGDGSQLINLPIQSGTYSNANVTSLLSSGTYSGNIQVPSGSITAANITSLNWLTVNSYLQAGAGMYSAGAYSGSYSNGVLVDYVTGSGRISVTGSDNLSFYSGGLATTPTMTIYANGNISTSGRATVGNIASTNGYFWANGAVYSTGTIFSGDLLGNTLQDSTRNRVFINAAPYSAPTLATTSAIVNPPVYSGGVLQAPTSAALSQVFGQITVGNVGLQSSYQTTNNRTTTLSQTYNQVWPVTANTMTGSDRVRGLAGTLDIQLNGKTWGAMSSAAQGAFGTIAVAAQNIVTGPGEIAQVIGTNGTITVTPQNGQANVQYATALMGTVGYTAGTNPTASNVAYARLVAGSITGVAGNLTVTNAIGLHTYSGWAGSSTNKFTVLNEDNASAIKTNANVIITSPGFAQLSTYTATTLRTYTGQAGWVASVSDVGGQIAYWDTTNTRWSYINGGGAV